MKDRTFNAGLQQERDKCYCVTLASDGSAGAAVWPRDSHSELQLRDVRNLITSECDAGYIERGTGELGVDALWRECLL